LSIHFAAGQVFASPLTAGLLLVVTGALLMATRWAPAGRKGMNDIGWCDALWIGLVQKVAVFPGISRSGSTIATALFLGIERDAAARFGPLS
jgi:undecaprenyl-diphosphatase